jgi:hypothetical protein
MDEERDDAGFWGHGTPPELMEKLHSDNPDDVADVLIGGHAPEDFARFEAFLNDPEHIRIWDAARRRIDAKIAAGELPLKPWVRAAVLEAIEGE